MQQCKQQCSARCTLRRGYLDDGGWSLQDSGGLDPRDGTLQPQGHVGALDQDRKETGVGFGMEGGAGRQKITVGRVKGRWSHRGRSADGGMDLQSEKGASPHSV